MESDTVDWAPDIQDQYISSPLVPGTEENHMK